MLIEEQLTQLIIGAAIEVHRELGPGLLESAYQNCLSHELRLRHLRFSKEIPIPVAYKNVKLDCGYRADIIVEEKVILEIKAVETLLPIHESQLITYLRLTKLQVGFLMNFNVNKMKDGIVRRVL